MWDSSHIINLKHWEETGVYSICASDLNLLRLNEKLKKKQEKITKTSTTGRNLN